MHHMIPFRETWTSDVSKVGSKATCILTRDSPHMIARKINCLSTYIRITPHHAGRNIDTDAKV